MGWSMRLGTPHMTESDKVDHNLVDALAADAELGIQARSLARPIEQREQTRGRAARGARPVAGARIDAG